MKNNLWSAGTIEETRARPNSRRNWDEKEPVTIERLGDGRWSVWARGNSIVGPSLEAILLDLAFRMGGYVGLDATQEDVLDITRVWANKTIEGIEERQLEYEGKVLGGGVY